VPVADSGAVVELVGDGEAMAAGGDGQVGDGQRVVAGAKPRRLHRVDLDGGGADVAYLGRPGARARDRPGPGRGQGEPIPDDVARDPVIDVEPQRVDEGQIPVGRDEVETPVDPRDAEAGERVLVGLLAGSGGRRGDGRTVASQEARMSPRGEQDDLRRERDRAERREGTSRHRPPADEPAVQAAKGPADDQRDEQGEPEELRHAARRQAVEEVVVG
jgi:hypothetical protein